MDGSVHHMSTFRLHASAFRVLMKVINLFKMLLKALLCYTFFIAEPAGNSINAHSIFARIEFSYNAKKKQVAAAAQMCSEKSESTTFFSDGGQSSPGVQSSPGFRYG